MNKKSIFLALAIACAFTGCDQRDSVIVSDNLSVEADSFNIPRQIVFYNGVTDTYIMKMTGFCSIKDAENLSNTIAVICKTPEGYKKNYMHLSDNVTYVSEQLSPAQVSKMQYELVFKPVSIIPIIKPEL